MGTSTNATGATPDGSTTATGETPTVESRQVAGQEAAAPGEKPKDGLPEASGYEALGKALKAERESRKAAEKALRTREEEVASMAKDIETLQGELAGYKRRDAVEAALAAAVDKARNDTPKGQTLDLDIDRCRKLLARVGDADLDVAAGEIVAAAGRIKTVGTTTFHVAGAQPGDKPSGGPDPSSPHLKTVSVFG